MATRRFDGGLRRPGAGVGLADSGDPFIGSDEDGEIALRGGDRVLKHVGGAQDAALDVDDLYSLPSGEVACEWNDFGSISMPIP